MYLTEAWWNVSTYFVVGADSPVHSAVDLRNLAVVYASSPPLPGPLSNLLPEIKSRALRSSAERLPAVCEGTASAPDSVRWRPEGAPRAIARKHQQRPLPLDTSAIPALWTPPLLAVTAVAATFLSLLGWALCRLRAAHRRALHAALD